jgi:hypothetical protein
MDAVVSVLLALPYEMSCICWVQNKHYSQI